MKTKLRTVASLLALGAIGVLVIAGCGGGGSSTGSTAGGSSDSFSSGAEAACSKANKQIEALGTPQQEEVTDYLAETEAVIETLHKEVAAVAGSGQAEAAYVKGLAEAIPVLTAMTNAARSENLDAVRELSGGLVEIHLGELAEAADLKSCAEVPVSQS